MSYSIVPHNPRHFQILNKKYAQGTLHSDLKFGSKRASTASHNVELMETVTV
jgi:hypothetical protein